MLLHINISYFIFCYCYFFVFLFLFLFFLFFFVLKSVINKLYKQLHCIRVLLQKKKFFNVTSIFLCTVLSGES